MGSLIFSPANRPSFFTAMIQNYSTKWLLSNTTLVAKCVIFPVTTIGSRENTDL